MHHSTNDLPGPFLSKVSALCNGVRLKVKDKRLLNYQLDFVPDPRSAARGLGTTICTVNVIIYAIALASAPTENILRLSVCIICGIPQH